MVDSIEIRLDQLTQAIKGLYAKSSMSQGEIYNALTSLSQRYENLTNVSSEKISATLINEFRKTMDSKYSQTNQSLKELDNSLRAFLSTQQTQSPKTVAEITRLINDTANIYSKLNSQDLALQKIFDSVELQKNNLNNNEDIATLTQNFRNFSQGFENITITLNKNFADFLSQLKANSTKDEFSSLSSEINTISGNVKSVISAITVIDTKYLFVGVLLIVANNILPCNGLCSTAFIPSLNFGIYNLPFSKLTYCGIVKLFLDFFFLNTGNFALP